MDKDVQLLVHAGAPGSRKDDDRYISQTLNFLGIGTSKARRIDLTTETNLSSLGDGGDETDADRENAAVIKHKRLKRNSSEFLQDTQLAYGLLESQLISSSIAAARAALAASQTQQHRIRGASTALIKIPSASPSEGSSQTSSYLKTPKLNKTHIEISHGYSQDLQPKAQKRKRIERHVGYVVADQGDGISRGGISGCLNRDPAIEPAADDGDSTSELPTSYSLSASADASDSQKGGSHEQQPRSRMIADRVGLSTSDTSTRTYEIQKGHLTNREIVQARSVMAKAKSPDKPVVQQTSSPGQNRRTNSIEVRLADLPMTINPPPPDVSKKPFTTHVTTALRHLLEESEVSDCFHPLSITRPINALERGYWLVKPTNWSHELKLEFWKFLHDFLRSGGAGWGVWCTRESTVFSGRSGASPLTSNSQSDGQANDFSHIELYCWGEVVRHTYLLLYLASKSRVRKMGLQWIDSEEKIVVQMRGASAANNNG